MKIFLTISALILVVTAGAAFIHHQYETHLSAGYAPIFKAAMMGSDDDRPEYIHEAQLAMRTDKDRATEAKLEKLQADATEEKTIAASAGFQDVAGR
jgi:hypothetical protein